MSEKVHFSEKPAKLSERALMEVIGHNNLEKWNYMKIRIACKTDEEFVTKLLDIAQEFLNRYYYSHSRVVLSQILYQKIN